MILIDNNKYQFEVSIGIPASLGSAGCLWRGRQSVATLKILENSFKWPDKPYFFSENGVLSIFSLLDYFV
ncbi:hypothetical protein AAEY33_24935 [Peribacillus simplex]|uniref:hypothetical protein n=1 Tax=Peribacillus simplex TaxID=1478 RepID=UPI0032677C18